MRRLIAVPFAMLLLLPGFAAASNARVPLAATVYGRGPELHLLPDFANLGRRVQVFGLGYRPGAHVRIVYGAPNASFMPTPLATATASARGRFHTSFVVTCALVVIRAHPPAHCSLGTRNPVRLVVIGGFANHSFSHKRTAALGFVVTPYAPPP